MPFKLLPRAERQLENIYLYTYDVFGERQADHYRDGLFAVFGRIAANPNLGNLYRGRTRRFVASQHLIYYRIERGEIVIARIDHGRQRRY